MDLVLNLPNDGIRLVLDPVSQRLKVLIIIIITTMKMRPTLHIENAIALMRDDVTVYLVTSKRGLVVMFSREFKKT